MIIEVVNTNWVDFKSLMPITMLGLLIHFLSKLRSARKKKDYSWSKFKYLNWIDYLISFLFCIAGIYFMSSGIRLIPGQVTEIVVAFILGVGGGSLVKKGLAVYNSIPKTKDFWSKIFTFIKTNKD